MTDRFEEIKAFRGHQSTEKMSIGWLIAEVERLRKIEDAALELKPLCPWRSITYVRVKMDFDNVLAGNSRPEA